MKRGMLLGLAGNNSLGKKQREHAVRGKDGGKPNVRLAVKGEDLFKGRNKDRTTSREERGLHLIKRRVDEVFKSNELAFVRYIKALVR